MSLCGTCWTPQLYASLLVPGRPPLRCQQCYLHDPGEQLTRFQQGNDLIVGLLDGGCAVLLKARTCEVYALPMPFPKGGPTTIEPVAQSSWQWKVDAAVMSPAIIVPTRSMHSEVQQVHHPIAILIRFGSIYPWVSLVSLELLSTP